MDDTAANGETVEIVLGDLLRWGTVLAATVIALGGAAYLVVHGGEETHYRTFAGEPSDLRSVSGIVAGLSARQSPGVIQLGLLLLIATPIARVAVALAFFALKRDVAYVLICLVVLLSLLYSLLAS